MRSGSCQKKKKKHTQQLIAKVIVLKLEMNIHTVYFHPQDCSSQGLKACSRGIKLSNISS